MKEKELMEFVQWLPQVIKEFQNKSPEEIVSTLNTMSQSPDGASMLQEWISAFKSSKKMFRKGGKMAQMPKFQKGGYIQKAGWGAVLAKVAPAALQAIGSALGSKQSGGEQQNAQNTTTQTTTASTTATPAQTTTTPAVTGTTQTTTTPATTTTPSTANTTTATKPNYTMSNGKFNWLNFAGDLMSNIGGALDIKQSGGVFDRNEAVGRKLRIGGVDEYGNMLVRGDQNVLAKKAKAASVKGFDESMYNYDPDQEFDRARYRARKRAARTINPEWTRRQRKAYALIDYYPTKDTELPPFPETSRPTPIGVVSVGDLTHSIEPSVVTPTTKQHIRRKVGRYLKPDSNSSVSWDQFAGTMYDALEKSGAFVGGQDSLAIQAWIANEYRKYSQNPYEYVYTQMPDDYVSSSRFLADEKTMQELGLSGYRSGAGYYDPNSTDFASVALRGNKSQKQLWEEAKANGAKAPIYWEQYYEDAEGNRYDDAEQARLHKLYGTEASWYDYGQKGTATQQEQKMDRVPESQFSNALNDMITTALMTGASGAGNYTARAAKGIWDGAKTGYNTALSAFREGADDYARAWMRANGGHGRFQPTLWVRDAVQPRNVLGQYAPWNYQHSGMFGHFIGGRAPYVPSYAWSFQKGGKIEETIDTPHGPIFETEDGEYVDIDGRIVDYNDRMENRRARHATAKKYTFSKDNRSYDMTVGSDLTLLGDYTGNIDTLIGKSVGFRKPVYFSNEDLGHRFEKTFPRVAKAIGFKSDFQQALDDIKSIEKDNR